MRRAILVCTETLGTSLTGLLVNPMVGAIFLDRRGTIVEADSRAREFLRQGSGLSVGTVSCTTAPGPKTRNSAGCWRRRWRDAEAKRRAAR